MDLMLEYYGQPSSPFRRLIMCKFIDINDPISALTDSLACWQQPHKQQQQQPLPPKRAEPGD